MVTSDQSSTFFNMYRHKSFVLTQWHLIPSSTKLYRPSTIKYQLVPPSTDPAPPNTNKYRLLLTKYHHISTSTAPYCPSSTKYHPIPHLIFLFAIHLMSRAPNILGLVFFLFLFHFFSPLQQIVFSFFFSFNYLTFLCQSELSTVLR